MSALVTEHFALQGTASATISESSSRSSMYLLTLSSSLVALSLAYTASVAAFAPFAAAVLPTVFVLGWFTVVRLVDTSIANVVSLRQIARIRTYYATLADRGPEFFPSTGEPALDAQQVLGTGAGRTRVFSTMASMIGTVNAIVGGTIVALVVTGVTGAPLALAVAAGAAAAAALVLAVVAYERRRFSNALGGKR